MEKKTNIISSFNLLEVYDSIISLQEKNVYLISKDLLKDLDSSKRYIYCLAKDLSNTYGFMILKDSIDVLELEYILVDKDYKNNNIGSMLINEGVKIAMEKDIHKIMLEVRKSNESAISFYLKNGFNKISERKDYYKDPLEDGLIFEKIV